MATRDGGWERHRSERAVPLNRFVLSEAHCVYLVLDRVQQGHVAANDSIILLMVNKDLE